MKVTVEICGVLRRPAGGKSRVTVELAQERTVEDLLAQLGYSRRERRALRLSRGEDLLLASSELHDGDELTLMAAFGGG